RQGGRRGPDGGPAGHGHRAPAGAGPAHPHPAGAARRAPVARRRPPPRSGRPAVPPRLVARRRARSGRGPLSPTGTTTRPAPTERLTTVTTTRRRLAAALLLPVLAFGVGACTDSDDGDETTSTEGDSSSDTGSDTGDEGEGGAE